MDPQPDDLIGTDDLTLLHAARSGDRLAFGVLYLRHSGAAWRIACVASKFSPDAELAVIEGFTRVFSALPAGSEEMGSGGVTFRPYLLACVRQAALDRARSAGRAEPHNPRRSSRRAPASPPPPAPLAGLTPDGEVVLSSLEHHVARGALASLPERTRTALWLSDVEAMTPGEVAGIIGTEPEAASALAAEARAGVRSAQDHARGCHEVRADCRFTVDHLGGYHAGTLDPKKGVLVRSHLDLCPPCRMRLGELANGPATLAAAVPAAPLLGGEAQYHWLASAGGLRPAERLLPPGLAAATPARHLPAVLRPVRDHRTRRVVGVAGAAPAAVRAAGRRARPAATTLTLVVAWLGVMLSLPQLMQPETAPGPGELALPAVQAYVPDFVEGAGGSGDARPVHGAAGSGGGDHELAARLTSRSNPTGASGPGRRAGRAGAELTSTPASGLPADGPPAGGNAAPPASEAATLPAVVTNDVPVVPLAVMATSQTAAPIQASAPESGPGSDNTIGSGEGEEDSRQRAKDSREAEKEARLQAKESRKAEKQARRAEKAAGRAEKKVAKASRRAEKESRRAELDASKKRATERTRGRPGSRARIVTA